MGSLATYPAGNDTIFSEAGAPCLVVLDALPDFSMQDREGATSAISLRWIAWGSAKHPRQAYA